MSHYLKSRTKREKNEIIRLQKSEFKAIERIKLNNRHKPGLSYPKQHVNRKHV